MEIAVELLIVEDSPTQALQLQALLEGHGFRVAVAKNGVEALQQVKSKRPVVIISDVVMPEMDGYTLCRELKSDPVTSSIPVILVTTLTDAQDVIRGLVCGADNFVTKPYDERYLLSRIRYFLANLEHREHHRVNIGIEVVLDGKHHFINAARQQILDLLISTYEEGVRINAELRSKHEELSRTHSLVNSLFHFTADLSATTVERDIVEQGLIRATDFPEVQAAWLLLTDLAGDQESWIMAGFHGHGISAQQLQQCAQRCPCLHACTHDKVKEAIDIDHCPALSSLGKGAHHATVPLTLGCEVIGILNVMREHGKPWHADAKQALQSIGQQFSVALGRARLFGSLETLVEQRTSALQAEMRKRERAQMALANNEALLRKILETLPVGVYVADQDGDIISQNPAAEHIWGGKLPPDIESGKYDVEWWDDKGYQLPTNEWPIYRSLIDSSPHINNVAVIRTNDGKTKTVLASAVPLMSAESTQVGAIGVIQDISRQRRAEMDLRLRNRAIESSVNAIIVTEYAGKDNPIVYTNPAFTRITGYSKGEILGQDCRILQRDDVDQIDIQNIRRALQNGHEAHALLRNYRKDGSLFWNELQLAPVFDDFNRITHFVGVLNDVTETKRYQEELEYKSNFDQLTGLPNRNLAMDRIQQAIALSSMNKKGFALAFLDLDNFKYINDSSGHDTGDRLIKSVAQDLAKLMREADTLARIGGDEFIMLIHEESEVSRISFILNQILTEISRPRPLDGGEYIVTCSVGFCFYPADGLDATTLLKNADTAMYKAKERGRNQISSYTHEMNEIITRRMELQQTLRGGIEKGELELYYQPQVDARTLRTVGLEALVRWKHGGRIISPAEFIPVAEETGLIIELDEWVIHTACQQAKQYFCEAAQDITVSVNLSARQFESGRCISLVQRALAASGLAPHHLKVEVTESMVMQNAEEALSIMKQLKLLGVGLSMDDFGTGYSSLSSLKRFPFDQLKIDKSFVDNLACDQTDIAVVSAILGLSNSLGVKTIAEGVETREQLDCLVKMGCDQIQGYYYSPPLPINPCLHFLKNMKT